LPLRCCSCRSVWFRGYHRTPSRPFYWGRNMILVY
jgi:hypothetical protein